MRKAVLIFVSLAWILTSCQKTSSDPSVLTLKQVLATFEEQQLSLKEIEISDNIFGMKLNGVSPYTYELAGKQLFVYIYSSTTERERGLEDFRIKTEKYNIVSYSNYEVKNVLLFYVYETDLDFEVDNKIKNVVSNLNEN